MANELKLALRILALDSKRPNPTQSYRAFNQPKRGRPSSGATTVGVGASLRWSETTWFKALDPPRAATGVAAGSPGAGIRKALARYREFEHLFDAPPWTIQELPAPPSRRDLNNPAWPITVKLPLIDIAAIRALGHGNFTTGLRELKRRVETLPPIPVAAPEPQEDRKAPGRVGRIIAEELRCKQRAHKAALPGSLEEALENPETLTPTLEELEQQLRDESSQQEST